MVANKQKRVLKRTSITACILTVCVGVVLMIQPGLAQALPAPNYSWYVGHESDSSYSLTSEAQFLGFINLVNGTADTDNDSTPEAAVDFADKTVSLTKSLSYSQVAGNELIPIGTSEHPFAGTFDGAGYTIDNYNILTVNANTNVGLFGYVKTSSGHATATVKNLSIGSGAYITIERTAATQAAGAVCLSNIGTLVGFCDGDIINCNTTGTVTITNAMNQTETEAYAVKNVGGLAGMCWGNMTSCTNGATLDITSTGSFDKTGDNYVIMMNIGGIVGCAGDEDSTVNASTTGNHGTISGCVNNGTISADCNGTTYEDRFGNKTVTLQINAIGGIAGYSRDSVTNCVNNGTFDAFKSIGMGGIVGALRSGISSNNFSGAGSDDGMAVGASSISVSNCRNTGSLVGYAFVAGIVGRAGTSTYVENCLNGIASDGTVCGGTDKVYILALRSTKPFPAGIVGSTYGTVRYCGNFGEVASAVSSSINLNDLSTYAGGTGYYASGIAGITQYYTDNDGYINQAVPEVYGCFNAGVAKSLNDAYRNRSIIGDNEGYAHHNIAVQGTAPEMYYTESNQGTTANNYEVTGANAKSNAAISDAGNKTPIEILNTNASNENWSSYWTVSNGTVNEGFPVLNTQVSWSKTDIAGATVSWKADAQYNGAEAVPEATVILNQGTADEKTLIQNVDFKVVPQAGATNVSYATDAKDYTASVVGIGSYEGTAAATFTYDIQKGDLSNCSVVIEKKLFNWESQTPTNIEVRNSANQIVASSEYTFAFDSADEDLTSGQAINAGAYTVIITAANASTYYYGNTTGEFAITKVKLVWSDTNTTDIAMVQGISYLGENLAWESTSDDTYTDENRRAFEYTGHSIQPSITSVTYKGHTLVANSDYYVYYGSGYQMDGDTPDATPNTELGEDGWILVRGAAGSNFTNYDMMKFKIVEASGALDISKAVVNPIEDIIYEEGDPYEPVVVSYGGSTLTKNTDYTITYNNNSAIGTASYSITGIGAYTGTKNGTFNIVAGQPYTLLYEYDDTHQTATVTGVEYNGIRNTFALIIPETVTKNSTNYTVTTIANNAFGGNSNEVFTLSAQNLSKQKISSVSIPKTVITINECALGCNPNISYTMSQLTSVVFAEESQLETIGTFAFATTGITTITIPASVESLGNGAFANTSLTSIYFDTTDASLPTSTYSTGKINTFYHVNNVQAYAYSETLTALSARINNNTWTWNDRGAAPIPTPSFTYGDVNNDGVINVSDASAVLKRVVGKTVTIVEEAADVNGDSQINVTDASLILKKIVGKITTFPAEQ